MGKGDKRRGCLVSLAEERLRWQLAMGEIKLSTFKKKLKQIEKEG